MVGTSMAGSSMEADIREESHSPDRATCAEDKAGFLRRKAYFCSCNVTLQSGNCFRLMVKTASEDRAF